jgi:GNAT superfamily N-acetyltransferase
VTAVDTGGIVRCRREPPLWRFGDLEIRRYSHPAEFQAVLDLHRTGLAQVGLRPGDGVYYESDLFEMEDRYLCAGGELLVGLRSGTIVAMGGLRRFDGDRPHIGEMVRLRVHPSVQRRGYGTALAQVLEERAADMGYRELRADTTAFQVPALEIYRRLGWRETHRRVISGIVNVYLVKPLECAGMDG